MTVFEHVLMTADRGTGNLVEIRSCTRNSALHGLTSTPKNYILNKPSVEIFVINFRVSTQKGQHHTSPIARDPRPSSFFAFPARVIAETNSKWSTSALKLKSTDPLPVFGMWYALLHTYD
jgi:hypothetical protein